MRRVVLFFLGCLSLAETFTNDLVLVDFSPYLVGKLRSRVSRHFEELEGQGSSPEENTRRGRLLEITEKILEEEQDALSKEVVNTLDSYFGPSSSSSAPMSTATVLVGDSPPPKVEFDNYSAIEDVRRDLKYGQTPEGTENRHSKNLKEHLLACRRYYQYEIDRLAASLDNGLLPTSIANKLPISISEHRDLTVISVARSSKYGILVEIAVPSNEYAKMY